MSSEEVLIQTRKDKHRQANGGVYPVATHAYHYPLDAVMKILHQMQVGGTLQTTINQVDLLDVPDYLVAGRLSAFRKTGAISFLKLTDSSGSMQLIASRVSLPNYQELHLLDLGDIVEIRGYPCLSKTGEKSLLIASWKLLTKAHRPPPEKFAGISDPELKYRKRYLDLMSSEEARARFIVRSMVICGIRKAMEGDEFVEVETSTLNSISSGANAKPFITHHNALDKDLYLRIAPELYLKRLLVGGLDRVYEIGRAYRNEGIDTRHNPEFTIMESYQAYADFPQLIANTQRLLERVDLHLQNELRQTFVREQYAKWKAERPFTLDEFRVVPMKQAVETAARRAGITLKWNGEDLWAVKLWDREFVEQDLSRRDKMDGDMLLAEFDKAHSHGEKLAVLFEHIAEPFLAEDYRTADGSKSVPVFITEYPKETSPLARVNDQNPDVVDRFELFIEGLELANAFQELNDPDEQAICFQQQLESSDRDPMQYDADYVQALEHGLPPCIGLGLGIDRLVMLLTGASSIKDVILFPTLKPIESV